MHVHRHDQQGFFFWNLQIGMCQREPTTIEQNKSSATTNCLLRPLEPCLTRSPPIRFSEARCWWSSCHSPCPPPAQRTAGDIHLATWELDPRQTNGSVTLFGIGLPQKQRNGFSCGLHTGFVFVSPSKTTNKGAPKNKELPKCCISLDFF